MARTQRTPRASSRPRFDFDFRPRRYRWPRRSRHPSALSANEITIVRVVLATPHRDVITLRARRGEDGRIRYRMVHEGAPATPRIRAQPTASAQPLSMGELVALLDGAYYDGACTDAYDQECYGRVIWGTLRLHFENGIDAADAYLGFATITSAYYPQLDAFYSERLAEWCLEHCEEEEGCGKVVRMRMRRG